MPDGAKASNAGTVIRDNTSFIANLCNSIDSEFTFSYLSPLIQKRIDPTTGEIENDVHGAWSCEKYYDIYKIDTEKSRLQVPEGYLLKNYYYDENKSYIDIAGYLVFELTDAIKYSVIIAERKTVSKDLVDVKNTLTVARGLHDYLGID